MAEGNQNQGQQGAGQQNQQTGAAGASAAQQNQSNQQAQPRRLTTERFSRCLMAPWQPRKTLH